MYRDREREADECRHWDQVVSNAAPCEHIVQLYQDQDFLNRAVCRFAGAAIANGEGIILVPTRSTGTLSGRGSRPKAWMSKRHKNADS